MNFQQSQTVQSVFYAIRTICFSLALCISVIACVRLDERVIPPGSPPILLPEAGALAGQQRDNLVVVTDTTVNDIPMHTQLIRTIANKSRNAVVSVYTQTKTPYRVRLIPIRIPGMGFRVHLPGASLGSGFFIHPSGYILTNSHVIDHAEEIKIMTYDDIDYDVVVIAKDPGYDLALLKVVNPTEPFPTLPMGNSDDVDSGDFAIAVGNPLGLGHTVTSGIISHMGRDLSGVPENEARQVKFIQTDAAINPGSSGGPLITLTGAWIGVNTAGTVNSQGIGFAIPSRQVMEFFNYILKGDESQRSNHK